MNPKLQLRRYARAEDRKLKAYEKKYSKAILRVLNHQLDEAIRNLQSGAIFLDVNMNDVLSNLYKEVGVDIANSQYDALTSFKTKANEFFLNTWLDFMTNYILSSMAGRVTGINDTTRKKIQETIAIGFNLGLETEQIAQFLRERIGTFNVYRSIMIARTEIAEAANIAKDRSSEDWERETGENLYKVWIHRYARDPRHWHVDLDNNKAIPKPDKFIVTSPRTGNTVHMDRPHDPAGGAENSINCSCVVVYISESYARRLNSTK